MLLGRWGSLVPFIGEGRGCVQGSDQRSGLNVLPTPGGVKFRGKAAQYRVFPPDTLIYVPISSEVLGGGVFLYLVAHNLPQLHTH